jgi:hypothetical protein
MLTFRKHYFLITVLLFVTELLIATFLHDRIIRPYFGDFLVVILVYCFLRSFFKVSIVKAAIATLVFAYLIECMQYLNLIQKLGLQNSKMANLILGNLFQWIDLLAYTLGILLVLLIEKMESLKIKSLRST